MGGKKKGGNEPSKKTVEKAKAKIVEDKTFGLKNKNKSKVVQNYIKGVSHQVHGGNSKGGIAALESKEFQERAEKKKQKEEEAFLNTLTKTVNVIKQTVLEDGQRARDVLCAYFKENGFCPDGDECEFSHDLNIEFNQGAVDIYTDLRDVEMFKLAEERDGKRKKVQSTIVCKFFLDAIQKKVYGLKWDCPNGDECHYRHCIPKDMILKKKGDAMQEDMTIEEFINLEEQIDAERTRITQYGKPVTDENYEIWRKARDEQRKKAKSDKEKELALRQTGIQLFKNSASNNIIIQDDEGAADIQILEGNGEDIDVNDEIIQKDNFFKPEIKDDENTLDELTKKLRGIQVNEELFQGDENLDELDNLEEEDDGVKKDAKEGDDEDKADEDD